MIVRFGSVKSLQIIAMLCGQNSNTAVNQLADPAYYNCKVWFFTNLSSCYACKMVLQPYIQFAKFFLRKGSTFIRLTNLCVKKIQMGVWGLAPSQSSGTLAVIQRRNVGRGSGGWPPVNADFIPNIGLAYGFKVFGSVKA